MNFTRAASSSFICVACQRAAAPFPSSNSSLIRFAKRISLSTIATPTRPARCAFSTRTAVLKSRDDAAAIDAESAFSEHGTESPVVGAQSAEPIEPAKSSEATPLSTSESATEGSPDDVSQEQSPTSAIDYSIPWYLRQNAAAREAQRPIEIPNLPPNPPPLLKTILEYVSITAGLDNLTLLDLRHLDPPPALGPKLIMIIATARSEKHLHVAADGFARYLRREHGLLANAAGLLGRNELKIKLRRKAKRMRMLANVGGAMPEGNIDDGIRTGWICCTLSKIEAHPDDMHMPGDNVEEFVGFRNVNPGVNVVVQMFTEEKRAETDLETLWGGVLKTHQREGKVVEEKLKELHGMVPEEHVKTTRTSTEVDRASIPAPLVRPARLRPSTPGDIFPPASSVDNARQVRRLHTLGL
ncbi:ATPase synthesis protein 25 mitochondrial [Pleosporales sp. CAS-2024a]